MNALARAALLGVALSIAACEGEPGARGPSAVVLQTLTAEPTIARPGCTVRVRAVLSEPAEAVALTWTVDRGAVVATDGAEATVRAPELEELSRLPSGFTVQLALDAGELGQASGAIGVVVDRRLGAPCED